MEHKFEVAGNREKDDKLFWIFLNSKKELLDMGFIALKKFFVSQTSDYVNIVLGQMLNTYVVLYVIDMRLNKEDDVRYAVFVRFPILRF